MQLGLESKCGDTENERTWGLFRLGGLISKTGTSNFCRVLEDIPLS